MIAIVGAGPGAPDLITIRGAERLRNCDVVIWASSLIPKDLLAYVPDGAEIFDSATMTLEDVLSVYEAHRDDRIVRLHSGDPSVYGAIQEQIDELIRRELDFEIVPGVTSVAGAAAAIGRELTIPLLSQSVVFTRFAKKTSASMPSRESVSAYAKVGGTLAIFLSAAYPTELQDAILCEGSAFDEHTPAAIFVRVTWEDETIIKTTCGELAAALKAQGAKRTVLVIVGDVIGTDGGRSHLYSPTFAHKFRKRSKVGETQGRATSASRSSL